MGIHRTGNGTWVKGADTHAQIAWRVWFDSNTTLRWHITRADGTGGLIVAKQFRSVECDVETELCGRNMLIRGELIADGRTMRAAATHIEVEVAMIRLIREFEQVVHVQPIKAESDLIQMP